MATVDAEDLEDAVLMVSEAGVKAQAWVGRDTGKVHVRSGLVSEDLASLPKDIDDASRYIPVPSVSTLGLGLQIVFDFARAAMPERHEQVQHMFTHPGAYHEFVGLVEERGLTDRWHAFREAQTRAVLQEWCADKGLQLAG